MEPPHVEGAYIVVAQGFAIDGPERRHGGRQLFLVVGEPLQLVERHRCEVELPGEGVELPPRADHQGGEFVLGHRGVLRRRVGLPHLGDRERIGGEERTVDVVVAVADLVEPALRRADAVLQDAVFDNQLAVVAVDAVHLRRVEEIGEDDVGDRYEDEPHQNLADEAVGPQPERRGDHLARQCFGFVREPLYIRLRGVGSHTEKTRFIRANLA